jgi:predicted ATP-grasp superfamily ATP-dependent carboligase
MTNTALPPNEPSKGPEAVIIGLEENGLGVARALADLGIRCRAVTTPKWEPAYATRTCSVTRCAEWSADALMEALADVGRKLESRAPLLITKDEPVLWVSDSRARLSEYFEINLPAPEVVDLLMSKVRFCEFAAEQGWPVPRTFFVNTRSELASVQDAITYPCILKPAVKNSAFRAHAPAKAFTAHSAPELMGAYELIATWEPEAVVQEWIAGGDDRIAYCLVYYDRNGDELAIFPGRKLRQCPRGCGNTAIAAPAPDSWREPMLDLTRAVMSKVGFKGLGSIEFKVRPDDSLVIMEPTVGRTNWQSEVAVLNGVNIPAVAYFDLIGSRPDFDMSADAAVVKLVDGHADLIELKRIWKPSGLSFAQWLKDRRGRKRYMRWRASDPMPTLAALSYFVWRAMRYAFRLPFRAIRRVLRPAPGRQQV